MDLLCGRAGPFTPRLPLKLKKAGKLKGGDLCRGAHDSRNLILSKVNLTADLYAHVEPPSVLHVAQSLGENIEPTGT